LEQAHKTYHKNNILFGFVKWNHYNASFYDIKVFFQVRDEKDRLNTILNDETYNRLIAELKDALKTFIENYAYGAYDGAAAYGGSLPFAVKPFP
jgi:hypothetical protein